MMAFLLHIKCSSILHIPSTTIDILVSALRLINLFTLPCQKITVYSWELARMVRTETVPFFRVSLESTNNWKGIRQAGGTIWSGPVNPRVLTLNGKDEGKQRRHETRCFLYLQCFSTHTHAHIKAFGWRLEHELKSGQSNPAVLLESKELWCNILIYAGSQLAV